MRYLAAIRQTFPTPTFSALNCRMSTPKSTALTATPTTQTAPYASRHHGWSPEKQALFQASMIELGVLAGLILTMVFAIFLLHRARDDGKPAGDESASSGQ